MKKTGLRFFIFCTMLAAKSIAQTTTSTPPFNTPQVITSDISNFWTAYDKITTTNDSAQQYSYIHTLFIDKGTPGLKAIMNARNYTARSYINAIHAYPLFWRSIRANTLKAPAFAADIALEISKLKKYYPDLKPASIYFTIGALRSSGTTLNGMVLIGSELAMTDKNTVATEFTAPSNNFATFFRSNPINAIVLTNVHEYIHAQQKTTIGNNLLAQNVLEGVAEFISVTATGKPSTTPAIPYGKAHDKRVRQVFSTQLFNPFTGFWLYNNEESEFHVRDLGYYVGYAICEKYYNKMKDKKQAVKTMIELDYNNESDLEAFIDQTGYFASPVSTIREEFEKNRPTIVALHPFSNNDTTVNPGLTQLTITFSTPMNQQYQNFELGPLGENNIMRVKKVIGFSEDGQSLTIEVALQPHQQYQLTIGEQFRSTNGISLKPYLINFKTADQ